MHTDAFDLHEKKNDWGSFKFYALTFFYSLIVAADIAIYLSFIIINGNLSKAAKSIVRITQVVPQLVRTSGNYQEFTI